jgi:acetoacetate decarboxylase
MTDELNPPQSPAYARPPWTYTGARILNVVCRAENARALARWVPPPLRLAGEDGLFVMFFLRVPSIPELGEHYHSTESGILIPVTSADGAIRGSTFAIMFVDNDVAQAGGREIWGYPKKLGAISVREDGDRIACEARHLGYRDPACPMIFSAEVELDGSGEAMWPLVATLEPRLLRRAIPDPYGPTAQSVEVLKVAHTAGPVYEQRSGRATASLGRTAERLDEWGKVEALGATFRVCDFVLPYAQRV